MGKLTVFKCSTLSSYTPVTVFVFLEVVWVFLKIIILAFDFCWFCVVIRFFHLRHNVQ